MTAMPSPGQLAAIYDRNGWNCWRPPTRAEVAQAIRLSQAHPGLATLTPRDTFVYRLRMEALKKAGLTWRPQYQGDGTCLVPGTLVRMADGSERPIEEVRVGDKVPTPFGNVRRVTRCFSREYTGPVHSVLSNGRRTTMTADHELLVVAEPGGPPVYCRADLLTRDTGLVRPAETGPTAATDPRGGVATLAPAVVETDWRVTTHRVRNVRVHDIEVEHDHAFIADGLASSNCVGQGGKLAADNCMAVTSITKGLPFVGRAAVAGMYPGSRVDVAGRPGSWQGSTGYWLNQWATKRGGVLLLKHVKLPEDSRREDELLALKWCNSSQGVPTDMEALAKERVLSIGTLCTNVEEAARGIQAGGTLVMCSNLIPTGKRDSRGYSPMRRSGGHCTVSDAIRWSSSGSPEGFLYQNSWSEDWGSGPIWPDDQPAGSVWVTRGELAAVLQEEDSYMWFGIDGPAMDQLPGDVYVL